MSELVAFPALTLSSVLTDIAAGVMPRDLSHDPLPLVVSTPIDEAPPAVVRDPRAWTGFGIRRRLSGVKGLRP